MIINELFTDTNGLFEKIFKPIFPTLYLSIFGDDDPQIIDRYLSSKYGKRTLFDAITNENAKDIVTSIITLKLTEWQKQVQAFNKEYDVLNPVSSKETVTYNNTVEETGNNNTVDLSKTFNDGDFDNDTKQQRDTTGNRHETGTKTNTKSSIPSRIPVSEIIQKEINLRKNNFKTQVVMEIVKELTVDIY